jgi:hypothetical protein
MISSLRTETSIITILFVDFYICFQSMQILLIVTCIAINVFNSEAFPPCYVNRADYSPKVPTCTTTTTTNNNWSERYIMQSQWRCLSDRFLFNFLPNQMSWNVFFIFTLTGCRSLVVVLSLSKREVVSSSPTRASRVKPKSFRIGSDCSFAKSSAFRSENHGSFGYDLKNGGPMSQ